MPPLADVNKVLKIQFTGTYGVAKWANVMHLKYDGTFPTNSEANNIALSAAAVYASNLLPVMSTSAILTETIVTDLTNSLAATGTFTGSDPGGNANANAMNAGVAIAGSWKIHRRYRGGHPRTYLVGMTANNLTNTQNFSGAYVASVLSAFQGFLTDMNALTEGAVDPFTLVSVSYYGAGIARPVPLVDTILDVSVDTRVDSQRRRNGR